jgi:hypothetical protein
MPTIRSRPSAYHRAPTVPTPGPEIPLPQRFPPFFGKPIGNKPLRRNAFLPVWRSPATPYPQTGYAEH